MSSPKSIKVSKRQRLSLATRKISKKLSSTLIRDFTSLKLKVLFNIDIYCLIITHFRICEIITSLLLVNKTLFEFLNSNNNSLKTIKKMITLDYGKIWNDRIFSKILKPQELKNSYQVIQLLYVNLFVNYQSVVYNEPNSIPKIQCIYPYQKNTPGSFIYCQMQNIHKFVGNNVGKSQTFLT